MYVDFYYTTTQQIILVVVSLISGLSSFVASLLIISIIWRDGQVKLKFVYHRILFVASIIDCISSLAFAFSFLTVPKGIFWGALGNTSSCEASGFLTVLLGSQFLYNFGLAIYFLMIIYFGKSQNFIASHIEPFVHTISLCLTLGIAVWALLTESFNPVLFEGGWCQVAPYPPGCKIQRDKCTRGLTALIIMPVLEISFGAIPFIGILICMIMIVYRVRKTFKASLPTSVQQRLNERTKQTAIQAMLYIGAILIPFTLIIVSQNIKNYDPSVRFILGILVKLFLPMQGVFNFLIYIRPRIISMRQRDGDSCSVVIMIWRIVFGGSPDDESDFAHELSRPHVSSQIDMDRKIQIDHNESSSA